MLTAIAASSVAPPLIGECFVNLECRVCDTRMLSKYNLFVLEAVKGWRDPNQPRPKMIHHHGYGSFADDGRMIRVKSKMP